MAEIATATGRPFAEQVAQNYAAAIAREDYAGIRDYDKVLLGKMVADRQEITVDNTEDVREAKEAAFSEALKSLSNVAVLAPTAKRTGT
jgi:phosphopentomutase